MRQKCKSVRHCLSIQREKKDYNLICEIINSIPCTEAKNMAALSGNSKCFIILTINNFFNHNKKISLHCIVFPLNDYAYTYMNTHV